MKVLVVTNMYPNAVLPYSGRFVLDHVRALTDLGLEVVVFFTNPKLSRFEYFTTLPSLRTLLQQRFDVVHAQHTYCMFQLQAIMPRRTRRPPLVLTCHEGEVAIPAEYRDPGAGPIKRLVYSKNLKRRAARMADEVVAVSDQVKEALELKECTIIPSAVDFNLFRPMDTVVARNRIGMDRTSKIGLFPGNRRRHEKRFDLLESALPQLVNPIRLIAGGEIPPEEMPLYMNAADVVVQTSRYEGSPSVIKEAMACCRPVVTTDVGDVRWLLGDEPGHYIVPPKSQAVAAAIDAAIAFGQPTSGSSRLRKLGLTPQRTAQRYLEVYEEAVRRHGRP